MGVLVVALDGTVAEAVGDAAAMKHKSDICAEPNSEKTPPQPLQSQVILLCRQFLPSTCDSNSDRSWGGSNNRR